MRYLLVILLLAAPARAQDLCEQRNQTLQNAVVGLYRENQHLYFALEISKLRIAQLIRILRRQQRRPRQ